MACPIYAFGTGERCVPARCVDQVHLALLCAVIALRHEPNDLIGRLALAQHFQAVGAVKRADEGLRCHSANAAPNVGHGATNGEESAGNSDAQMSGLSIPCNDRIGHGQRPTA